MCRSHKEAEKTIAAWLLTYTHHHYHLTWPQNSKLTKKKIQVVRTFNIYIKIVNKVKQVQKRNKVSQLTKTRHPVNLNKNVTFPIPWSEA